MEACLGLGRNQRSNKSQKDLKLQQQQQQQKEQSATGLHHPHQFHHQHHGQKLQQPVTNQNYYTTQQQQQQPHQQRQHLITRNQQQQQQHQQQFTGSTNVGSGGGGGSIATGGDVKQKPPQTPHHQQQQHHFEPQQQLQHGQNVRQIISKATTVAATPSAPTTVRTMPKYKNAPSSPPFEDSVPPPPANTIQVDVTTTHPSSTSPTSNVSSAATNKSCRKISGRHVQQQSHQHHHHHQVQQQHLHQQQYQSTMPADLDAIEICAEPEPTLAISFKAGGGGAGMVRHTKTLGRLNQTHSMEEQWSNIPQTTSMQLLQLQQHQQQQQQQQHHDYSYAYYEPGAAMRHTNIPNSQAIPDDEDLTPAPPNSIRALLSKGKKNKILVSPATRQSYQVRLTQQHQKQFANQAAAGATAAATPSAAIAGAATGASNISTPENFYEEISASSTSSSSNSMTSHRQLRSTSHSAGSLTQQLVEEELRRVQNRHHKILGELNLSVEAMLMPESPPNTSPTGSNSNSVANSGPKEQPTAPTVSVTSASGQPLRLTSSSADNICDPVLVAATATSVAPLSSSATIAAGLLQTGCMAATDLDSGFSGSSGASYIGSLRLHKTNALMNSRTAQQSATTSGPAAVTQKSQQQQSAFAYATQSCRSFQRANTCIDTNASSRSHSSAIKHLPQVHLAGKHTLSHQHGYLADSTVMGNDDDEDVALNASGFFTRAACGRRILNCAKIRAAEDPGPVVVVESKARSFWNRKGWRKFPGFSTSTSSINDTGLTT
ncbi:G-box-binding factor-like, partial [Musca vetustissima]|uniref:G-box-binding factor-like n=1 Tax=Musca vetustissima TaxID=27455 RepID=UPI002AB693D2